MIRVLIVLFSAAVAIGQDVPKPPTAKATDFVDYLSELDGHESLVERLGGQFDCGIAAQDQKGDFQAVLSLIKLGPQALPAIEEALSS